MEKKKTTTKRHKMMKQQNVVDDSHEIPPPSYAGLRQSDSAASVMASYRSSQVDALKRIFTTKRAIMLVSVPIGLACKYYEYSSSVIFVSNFVALISLSGVLGLFTKEFSLHVGYVLAILANTTFGNIIGFILNIQTIKAGLVTVVQGGLLGTMITGLLPVLGLVFSFGGYVRKHQGINLEMVHNNIMTLITASISIILPTVFNTGGVDVSEDEEIYVSRASALVMVVQYILNLWFQCKTHKDVMSPDDEDEDETAEEDGPLLGPWLALGFMVVLVLISSQNSNAFVDTIEDVCEAWGVPKLFLGVMILPLAGSVFDHVDSIGYGYIGMYHLALHMVLDSACQNALLVLPGTVIAGWALDMPVSLRFPFPFMACFVLAVLLTGLICGRGEPSWYHGSCFVFVYLLMAIQMWFASEN